ncbi:MAG: HAD superfamily hydrolase (TIGR01509 family) [Cyclobacteriaceae bacterium]
MKEDMIKAVIFDMDGVIMDSESIHYKIEKAILKNNFNEPFEFEDHARFVGQTTQNLWRTICKERNLSQGFEILSLLDNADYMQELKSGDIQPVPGVIELIKRLHEIEIPMIVASSAIRENIEVVTDSFGITKYFQGYVSGQDVERTKPNPDIFLKAAEKLNIEPENCLVIEDAKHGVEAAKAANMFCIGYRNLNSGDQDLSKADMIVDKIDEIKLNEINELIKKQNTDYVT